MSVFALSGQFGLAAKVFDASPKTKNVIELTSSLTTPIPYMSFLIEMKSDRRQVCLFHRSLFTIPYFFKLCFTWHIILSSPSDTVRSAKPGG
jgi:hypothetical protein